MARRCGCSGDTSTGTCSCLIQGQGAIDVAGTGQRTNPYIVSGGRIAVLDTATVDLTLTGTGREATPWTLKADAKLTLDDLTDVATAGGTAGQILARKADGTYGLVPALTAPPGAISHDGSLTGDGSLGAPLSAQPMRDEIAAAIGALVLPVAQIKDLGEHAVRIRVGATGNVTLPEYKIVLTNPHPTLNLFVKCEVSAWLYMSSNRVSQAIYGEPITSGAGVALITRHTMRIATASPANTQGPYQSLSSFRFVLLAPGATLTCYPGLWVGLTDTPNLNISIPTATNLIHAVIPQSWMSDGNAVKAQADPSVMPGTEDMMAAP